MRTVVITGSGSGLGAAIRRRLEADGCRVVGARRPGFVPAGASCGSTTTATAISL